MTDLTFSTITFFLVVLNALAAIAIVFAVVLFIKKLINRNIHK